ncbi:protein takeout-like isoform X2 [Rhodnius prolixus]|uniref:protein takeout-like isoform X2 n=1 Tax=Rhodnius prolixus TaxID=13249 RepID=UPI003D1891F1
MHVLCMLLMGWAFIFHVQSAKLPKTWKTCKKDDPRMNDCLKIAIEEAVHDLVGGNPSLGVFPLDPMHFDTVSIDQGHGPVSIKLDFKHLEIIGVKDLKITNLKTDWKEMHVDFIVPAVIAVGTYNVTGQVLILPIQGNGFCNLTFSDNMNVFLNQNWPEILKELRPAVSKAFSSAFKEVGNRVFSKVPLELISPP